MTSNYTIPTEWVCTKLGDVAEQITKGTTPTTAGYQFQDSGIPFIKIENINEHGVNLSSISQFISEEAHAALARSQFMEGDVLFSIAGTIGKTAVVTRENLPANTNQAVAIIRGTLSAFDQDYLRQQLRAASATIAKNKARGGGMNNISLGDLKEVELSLPPLAEQKQIAAKLDELLAQVDNIKTHLDAIPAILKRFRQSVLAAAVSGRLTEDWRDSNDNSLSNWKDSNVGELAVVATGKTPKRSDLSYWSEGDIPWLTSASTGNPYTHKAEQFVTELAVKECTLKLFEPGTLLMAMYGEGKTRGQITEITFQATCNQACAAITVNDELVSRAYMKICLIENYEETRKAAAGGAQPNLNLNKVREIPVRLPIMMEQTEIVHRVKQLFTYADQIEQRVKDAQSRVNHLTQSILAKAFRGELTAEWREQNPDLISGENSAEALLEHIKIEQANLKHNKKVKS